MRVVVGRIGRAHGINGDVTVELSTDEPELRFTVGQQLFGGAQTFTVANSRMHSGKLLVHFVELPDRTAAERARGVELEAVIDPADTPAEDDEFYDRHLVGLTAYSAGEPVGTVVELQHHGAQDLIVIDRNGRRVLVPFVKVLVPEVDLETGRIVIADRPGLLDPDAADVAREPGQ